MTKKLKGVGGVMTISEAAKALCVSRTTIRRWLDGGKLSGITFGKIVFLAEGEVERVKNESMA